MWYWYWYWCKVQASLSGPARNEKPRQSQTNLGKDVRGVLTRRPPLLPFTFRLVSVCIDQDHIGAHCRRWLGAGGQNELTHLKRSPLRRNPAFKGIDSEFWWGEEMKRFNWQIRHKNLLWGRGPRGGGWVGLNIFGHQEGKEHKLTRILIQPQLLSKFKPKKMQVLRYYIFSFSNWHWTPWSISHYTINSGKKVLL